MKKNNKFSTKDRIKSFAYAVSGLRHFFSSEHNGWLHSIGALTAIALGIYLNISMYDWLWIFLAIFIVFITEFMNTAIERIVDLITKEKHSLAKEAKDIGAATVLLATIFSIIVAIVIFGKHLNFFS